MEARRALAEIGSVMKQLADVGQNLGEKNQVSSWRWCRFKPKSTKFLPIKRSADSSPKDYKTVMLN